MAAPAYQMIASYLQGMGLGALAPVDGAGNPVGWLADQIRQGFDENQIMMNLQSTDVFRDRFGVIFEQQARAARGEPVYVMNPSEVLQYEKQARQAMRELPAWFYDQPEDFTNLILKDISIDELNQLVQQGFEWVKYAPPEVRARFEEYYGVGQGDAALAAYVMDPNQTIGKLQQATRTAYAAGMGDRYDVAISRAMAERIGQGAYTEAGIQQGMQQVAQMGSVFEEGLFEATDLTPDLGVSSVFEGDAAANTAIERRQLERQAIGRSTTGGAATTQQGVVGAGSTRGGY